MKKRNKEEKKGRRENRRNGYKYEGLWLTRRSVPMAVLGSGGGPT